MDWIAREWAQWLTTPQPLSAYLWAGWWGMLGALLRIAAANSLIRFPERTTAGSVRLNAVGELFVGVVVGMLIDGTPLISVIAGYSGPALLELLSKGLVQGFRSAFVDWLRAEIPVVNGDRPEIGGDENGS